MEILKTIKTIRALANGVNPETPELLIADSVCRNPQAVIVLNRALAALVTRQQRELKNPAGGRSVLGAEDKPICEEPGNGFRGDREDP
jgi:hypothetical protein